ncbi:MAG TPA: GGDEF domain-containing protein [Gemmatimonadales bacterium]|nr:GGDEF domain-containing protein [Gemmatimonadales bacterium]
MPRPPQPASYTAGAKPPPLWSRPDPALAAAGVEGELVVARVRAFAMVLLLIAPTWNILDAPDDPVHRAGFSVTLVAALVSWWIFWRLRRRRWRPWIGFASSAFDVSMVSIALASFLIVGSPMVALNSKVTFEMYFLAITATSLRYDARVCITSGLLALTQYGGLWAFARSRFDLYDAKFVADAGPYLPVDIWTRLILLAIATVLAVTLVRRAQRLLYLAARDRLTGLFNRGHFDRAIATAMEIAARSGEPLSLAILDIDHFKQINDEHGHVSGDLTIRAVARHLTAAMRRTDVIARYGGEEFVVIMPGTTPAVALARMEALRRLLATTPLNLGNGHVVTVSFSAGIAGSPDDADRMTPDELVSRADQRLLAAKRDGRARCYGPAGSTATSSR